MAIEQSQRKVLGVGARHDVGMAGQAGQMLQQSGELFTKLGERQKKLDEKDKQAELASQYSKRQTEIVLEGNEKRLEITNKYASNPEQGYEEYIKWEQDRYKNIIESEENEDLRQMYSQDLDKTLQSYGTKLQNWAYNQKANNRLSDLNDSTAMIYNQAMSIESEDELAPLLATGIKNITLASKFGDVDSEKADELKKSFVANAYNVFLQSKAGVEPEQVLNDLDGGKYDEILEPAQKAKLLSQSAKNFNTQQKEKLEEAEKKLKISLVDARLSGESNILFDGYDKDDQEIINVHSQEKGYANNILQQDGNALEMTKGYADMGYIPENGEKTIRSLLNSGDPEHQIIAGKHIEIMEQSNPVVLRQFDDRTIGKAKLANKYIRGGIDPRKSWEMAEKETDPLNKEQVEFRRRQSSQVFKNINPIDDIEEALDPGWLTFGPDVPESRRVKDNLIAEYRSNLNANYIYHGDAELAREEAIRQLKENWQQTTVSGERHIMKNAPAQYYGLPEIDNDEWIGRQMLNEVRDLTGDNELEREDVLLYSDKTTDLQKSGGKPSYLLMFKKDGQYYFAKDKETELPVRFRPDNTKIKSLHNSKKQQEKISQENKDKWIREANEIEKKYQEKLNELAKETPADWKEQIALDKKRKEVRDRMQHEIRRARRK